MPVNPIERVMPFLSANAVIWAEAYWADSIGGSNTSIMEVDYGTSKGLDGHTTWAGADAVTGPTHPSQVLR